MGKPGSGTRTEAERDDHVVSRNDLLAARHLDRHTAAAGVSRAEFGRHDFDPLDAAFADDRHRLAVEQELHALFAGIGDLAAAARHIGFVAAVGAGDTGGTLADSAAVAVHRGIAAAEHHHALTIHVVEGLAGLGQAHVLIDIGHQIRERLDHARQGLAGETALHRGVSAHAEEHGVVVVEQLLERDVPANIDTQPELDAHAFHHLAPGLHHLLLELELGNAESQQSANLLVAIKHHWLNAVAHQDVGRTQTRRSRANDGNAPSGRHDFRHIWPPALRKRSVGDVLLNLADGHSAEALFERARAFAETVLRADAPAHLGQRVGLVRKLRRLEQAAFLDQLQPVRDVVVNRALPLTVRVAAGQTAARLLTGLIGVHGGVDLAVILDADDRLGLVAIAARLVEELERIAFHIGLRRPRLQQRAANRRSGSAGSCAWA